MSVDSDAHLEVDKEVRHARCDALKVAVAQACSIWVNLLGYPLVYLQDRHSHQRRALWSDTIA